MKKKLVLISTSLLSSIPLTVAVSCSKDNNKKPDDKTEDTMKPGDEKEHSKKPEISPEQQKLLNKISDLEKNLVYAKEELTKEKALFYYKFLSSQSKTDEQESESIEDLKNEIESLYDVINDFNKNEDLKNWVDLVYNAYLILFEKQELLDDLGNSIDIEKEYNEYLSSHMLLRNELKEYQDQINVLNMKDKKTDDEIQELENIIKIKEDLQDYLNILEIYSEFKPVQTQDALDWDKELKEFEHNPNALHQLNDEVKSFQDEIDALNQKTDKSDEDNEQLKTIQEAKSNLEEFIIALEVYKDYKNSPETDSDHDWQSLLDSIKASQQAIEELTQDIAKLKQKLQQ